jgi:hypothetical protein
VRLGLSTLFIAVVPVAAVTGIAALAVAVWHWSSRQPRTVRESPDDIVSAGRNNVDDVVPGVPTGHDG